MLQKTDLTSKKQVMHLLILLSLGFLLILTTAFALAIIDPPGPPRIRYSGHKFVLPPGVPVPRGFFFAGASTNGSTVVSMWAIKIGSKVWELKREDRSY